MKRPNAYVKDELGEMVDQTISFVEREVSPVADGWEEQGMVPRAILEQMGQLGMLGLRIPKEAGGLGMGPLASAAFAEALGSSTYGGFDVTVLVQTDMAGPHLINSGSPDQHDRYLADVLNGKCILAIAVTEPDAGSDVGGLRTTATRENGGWRINGSKTLITNGVYANLTITAARTDPDQRYGISMFLVPAGTEGFSVTRSIRKHGWRCSDTAELHYENVWVPDENLLGQEHRGFYEIMRNFQNERTALIGMGVGAAQRAIDTTVSRTHDRRAFGGALFDLGAIRQRLAMDQARLDAVRALMYHTAWMAESGGDPILLTSELKAFGGEVVNQILYDCVQFCGGTGYVWNDTVERISRDVRVLSIGGGATEVMLEEVAKRVSREATR